MPEVPWFDLPLCAHTHTHNILKDVLYHSIEIARGAVGLIRMDGDQTIISRPPDQRTGKESEDVKAFTFDKSYWSADKNDPRYADQQTVYNDMGEELLDHAFDGYNCCIFACKNCVDG